MISQSQAEIKNLLEKQLRFTHFKASLALSIAIFTAIITPLKEWELPQIKVKNQNEIINLISLITGVGCCTYTYIASAKIKEYGGKLTMFRQLEKERFIQEQIILQQGYLYQLQQQQIQQNYQQTNQSPLIDVVATPTHTHTHAEGEDTDIEEDSAPTPTPTHAPTPTQPTNPNCPNCGSSETIKHQKVKSGYRYMCKSCDSTFTEG